MIDTLIGLVTGFIEAIGSALNMIEIGISAFTDHLYPNVLGSVWALFPAAFQVFAIGFLIVGLFVALMAAVLKK